MTTFVAAVPNSRPMTRSSVSRRTDREAGLAPEGSMAVGLAAAWAACPADCAGRAWAVSPTDLPGEGGAAALAGGDVPAGVAVDRTGPAILGPPVRPPTEVRPPLGGFGRRSSARKRRRSHCQTRQERIGLLTPPGSNPRRSRLSAR